MKLKIIEDVEKNRLWKINRKLAIYKSMRSSYKMDLEEYASGYEMEKKLDWDREKLDGLKRKIKKLDKLILELEAQI